MHVHMIVSLDPSQDTNYSSPPLRRGPGNLSPMSSVHTIYSPVDASWFHHDSRSLEEANLPEKMPLSAPCQGRTRIQTLGHNYSIPKAIFYLLKGDCRS